MSEDYNLNELYRQNALNNMEAIKRAMFESEQRSQVMTVTPANISDFFGVMQEAVRNGEMNALELFAISKQIEKIASQVKKDNEAQAMDEAEKHGEKTFTVGERKFTRTEGKRIIDYTNIPEWVEAKDNLTAITDKYKSVALSEHASLDESTGEILERPIVTFGKPSLSVK